ncbi:hypothetical protein AB4090_14300 [Acidithiobacillus sp. IBUN Pt1247-S3]|uniref:hypothetical protein n=1 Tax=Acidithiobacillus sp. IBUN Pt1247-S3 TaxID=3166642 RepID=UPI0034E4FCE9
MADSTTSPEKKRNRRRAAAPAECVEFQRFYRALEADSSVSTGNMLEMFRDLGVYGHLTEIEKVCANLQEVLSILMELEDWQPYLDPVRKWPALLEWIHTQSAILPPSGYTQEKALKNPLVHVCTTSHPLYALLWTDTEPAQLQEFRLLQGHVLVAHLQKIRKHQEYTYDYRYAEKAPYVELIAGTYRCGLALREISLSGGEIVADILRPERPPEIFAGQMYDFWQALQLYQKNQRQHAEQIVAVEGEEEFAENDEVLFDLLRRLERSKVRVHLQSFCYDLAEAYELRKHGTRSRDPGTARHRQVLHGYLPLVQLRAEEIGKADDDPAKKKTRWKRGGEAANSQGEGEAGAKRYEAEFDLDSEENIGEEYLQIELDCALQGGGPPSLHSLALRGKMHAEALQNQLFPWEYDLLTDSTLRSLLTDMERDFAAELRRPDEKPSVLAEAIALLSILLWTGCALNVARKIQIMVPGQNLGLRMLSLQIGPVCSSWIIRVDPPSHRNVAQVQIPACEDVGESTIHLPDIAEGSQYLLQIRQRSPNKGDRTFLRAAAVYERELRKYLRKVDPSGYLSLTKIEEYLWRRLASSGDLAEADLLVGKQHRLSSVRRFYTTLAAEALAQRYQSVVSEILRGVGRNTPTTIAASNPTHYCVGAVYRPTVAAVRKAVAIVRKTLGRFLAKWQARSATNQDLHQLWRDHYNTYTLYTWLFFSYATAARATCAPFPQESLVDVREGFIAYADKTTLDRAHVRLLWMPEPLVSQLRAQQTFAWSVRDTGPARKVENMEWGNFLLGKRTAQPLCPKVLQPCLEKCFHAALPVNSHRRFCRSYLLEQGCPVEVVDAFMGHWFAGESPWSRYSSQSALEYARQLQPYLTKLLEDLGLAFVPLPSPKDLRKEG